MSACRYVMLMCSFFLFCIRHHCVVEGVCGAGWGGGGEGSS